MCADGVAPFDTPLTEDERAASKAAAETNGTKVGYSLAAIHDMWESAKTECGVLARGYCTQRRIDPNLIGPDELRTAEHAARPGGQKYPAIVVAGTNEAGAVTRVQAIRFERAPLGEDPPRVERLRPNGAKITNGKGGDPARFAALPDCTDTTLAIAEGPEDALTLRQILGIEAWATLGLSHIARLSLPPGRRVIVFADRGSEEETRKAAETLAGSRAEVWLALPPKNYKDVNEALQAGDEAAIRAACDGAERIVRPQLDGLPSNCRVGTDGWIRVLVEKRDKTFLIPVCRGLVVLAVGRDGNSTDWGNLLEITDPDGVTHRHFMPAESLVGDGVEAIKILRSLGLECDLAASKALLELINGWKPRARVRVVRHPGWADDECCHFLLGDGSVIGECPGEAVVLDDRISLPHRDVAHTLGTLDRWRSTVAARCLGNPLMRLVVSVAFIGPLLRPLGFESGGLHLVGSSSRGKSTLLRLANSVWRGPRGVRTWRATSNGLEGVAAAASGTLLALDELGEIAARDANEVAYMLGNGTGKTRANRTGRARAPASWQVMVVSTGELTLGDKIGEDRGRRVKAGQSVRIIDIPATDRQHGAFDMLHDAADAAAFANELKRAVADAHGTAGPAFVKFFLEQREDAEDYIHAAIANFVGAIKRDHGAELDGQVERVAQRFGLIAAAGELASRWSVTGWPNGAATGAARIAFDLWLKARGGTEAAEKTEAIKRVREFIARHALSRFEPVITDRDRGLSPSSMAPPVRDRAGWMWIDDDGEAEYYISPDVWRSEVVAGLNPERAARSLAEAGFLVRRESGRLTYRMPSGVTGRPRVYRIKGTILGGDDGERGDD